MATAEITDAADETLLNAKPPFLRRVRIRGYKSIAFCDVTLEPLTVFVGRNGSGKSNFLDALGFLRDAILIDLPEAVRLHGGPHAILCRAKPTTAFSLEVDVQFPDVDQSFLDVDGPRCSGVYRVDIELTDGNGSVRAREKFDLNGNRSQAASFSASNGSARFEGESSRPHPVDWLFLRAYGGTRTFALRRALCSFQNYNFNHETMRELQTPSSRSNLEKDGRNLASLLERLERENPSTNARIQAYLSAIVPEVTRAKAAHYGDYETVRFAVRPPRSQTQNLEFDATSMSDGTLRALAGLVAAFQDRTSPDLAIGIEEPETALHPAAMNALVDALDEATLRTQVLITTHSADLLDNSTIKPESIRVVQMIDGETVIAKVDAASIEIVNRQLNTLGGLERDDRLEADLDELDRLRHLRDEPEGAAP